MRLIKNAIVFSMDLPSAGDMERELSGNLFVDPQPFEARSVGFTQIPQTGEVLSEFNEGYAFAVRIDEKVVPTSAVKLEVELLCEKFEDEQGYKPGIKLRRELREEVIGTLVRKAIAKTSIITCYYDKSNNYLLIPVTSKSRADLITGLLIKAVGSIKAQTIYVSTVRHGLTTRLTGWLDGHEDAFGDMEPWGEAQLRRGAGERITLNLDSLDTMIDGTMGALSDGFLVMALRLCMNGINFRLTDDFHLRQIRVEGDYQSDRPEGMSENEAWYHDSAAEVFQMRLVVDSLCDMFGYKPTDDDEAEDDDPAAGL